MKKEDQEKLEDFIEDKVREVMKFAAELVGAESMDVDLKHSDEEDKVHDRLRRFAIRIAEDNAPEKQFNVPVVRTAHAHQVIAVTAKNEEEAIEKAIDAAGGESFSEKDAEYSAPDGAMEIKNR